MRQTREWFLRVPWGKLFLKSHGHPDGDPVFLVHGRQDSLSVFDPLIEQMTEEFYYVSLDMPGNGLSDAFPHVTDLPLRKYELGYCEIFDRPPRPARPFIEHNKFSQQLVYTAKNPGYGPKLQRFHFLYAMELAILHLGWDNFIFIGHSMGCEQGLFFNAIYPGHITKMILLDAGPTLMRMQVQDNEEYQRTFIDSYYDNYKRECFSRKKYSFLLAKQRIRRARELTEAQCAHILSRNFHNLGVNETYQREISSGPPDQRVSINTSVVEGRKERESRKANETRLIRTRKAIEALNVLKARYENKEAPNANDVQNVPQNADEPRNADETQNADKRRSASKRRNADEPRSSYEPRNVNESRNADERHNAHERRNASKPRVLREPRNPCYDSIEYRNAYYAQVAEEAQNAEDACNRDYAQNVEEACNGLGACNVEDAQNADGAEGPDEAGNYINFIERMRNDNTAGYLSWDNRLKNLAPQNYGNDYYFELFKNIPPTLLIAASDGAKNIPPIPTWRNGAKELLDKMATLENFQRVDVEGNHDVHYTHPERVLPYINAFLKDNKVSSKL